MSPIHHHFELGGWHETRLSRAFGSPRLSRHGGSRHTGTPLKSWANSTETTLRYSSRSQRARSRTSCAPPWRAATGVDEGDPAKIKTADFPAHLGQAARDAVISQVCTIWLLSPGLDAGWPLPKKFADAGVPLPESWRLDSTSHDSDGGIPGTNAKAPALRSSRLFFQGAGNALYVEITAGTFRTHCDRRAL